MSLCRWSHSPFYIYEECGSEPGEIKVSWEGNYYSKDIIANPYNNVYLRIREQGYGIIESVELLIWLYPWALDAEKKLSRGIYNKILNFTRFLSYVRRYCNDQDEEFLGYINSDVIDLIEKVSEKLDGNPIHKLTPIEKSDILAEYFKEYKRARPA